MSSQEHNEVVDDAEDPVDPRLSELVAYLDGELDDSACENVERELVSNPVCDDTLKRWIEPGSCLIRWGMLRPAERLLRRRWLPLHP